MSITFQELAVAMIKCPQTEEQSVYQHGLSVKEHFESLIYHLESNNLSDPNWKLPDWIYRYKNDILSNLHDEDTISKYTVYHDAGKPFCRTVDETGKQHFPDHANVSKKMFLEAGGCQTAANLIGWDMILHVCTSEQIAEKCTNEWTAKDAITLLIAGFAEIHSNAKLFNNNEKENILESTSFKIKYKQLDRRGKQIVKYYFGDK